MFTLQTLLGAMLMYMVIFFSKKKKGGREEGRKASVCQTSLRAADLPLETTTLAQSGVLL